MTTTLGCAATQISQQLDNDTKMDEGTVLREIRILQTEMAR